MTSLKSEPEGSPFIARAYAETMTLLCEARAYIAARGDRDRARMESTARLVYCSESLRVTARLGQAMAWILVRKAVQAGELTEDEACQPEYRLDWRSVCGPQDNDACEHLPDGLVSLIERSAALYARIDRLDRLLDAPTRDARYGRA